MLALVNPGDEVLLFDPYFVMYEPLIKLVDARPVVIDTYPDFRIDLDRVRAAITPRTKLILFNSPGNPTGAVADESEVRGLAELAAELDVALLSDEIYRLFCYDRPFVSPAKFNPQTIVIDGFSKSYGMTGWRLGYVHGPAALVEEMIKLQQYSFVCAPQPFQWAAIAALDIDMSPHIAAYRRKRDLLVAGLKDTYELTIPGGAFYAFPKAPWGSATEFVSRAIEHELLVIPGSIFSHRDTHFRISYAAEDARSSAASKCCKSSRKGREELRGVRHEEPRSFGPIAFVPRTSFSHAPHAPHFLTPLISSRPSFPHAPHFLTPLAPQKLRARDRSIRSRARFQWSTH